MRSRTCTASTLCAAKPDLAQKPGRLQGSERSLSGSSTSTSSSTTSGRNSVEVPSVLAQLPKPSSGAGSPDALADAGLESNGVVPGTLERQALDKACVPRAPSRLLESQSALAD